MMKVARAYSAVIASPIGAIGLVVRDAALIGIEFAADHAPQTSGDGLTNDVAARIAAYFADPATPLDLPMREEGTAFQRKVWQALREIPRGEPMSYGALARRLGTAARAVGGACRANPLPLLTPCHRVVSASGTGGFHGQASGGWVRAKEWLLAHERGECPPPLAVGDLVSRRVVPR